LPPWKLLKREAQMRSWTDKCVLCGLAVIGGGLVSLGAGKALAHYTISGSPILIAAADESVVPPPRQADEDGLVQLADSLAPPPRFPPETN
jgi:hypothetical protein